MTALLLAIAVTIAVLYVPGYLMLCAVRFSRLTAAICAPIVAFFLYAVASIAYFPLGIDCNPVTVGVIPLVLCLGCYAVSRYRNPDATAAFDVAARCTVRVGSRIIPFERVALVFYVAIGLFACWLVFVSQLPGGDAFYGRWDNQLHLNAVRSFLETGQWSSLHVSTYASSPDYAIPFANRAERYPAAWHDVVALVCAISGQTIPVCANALNIVLAGITYPSAMFLLAKALFVNDRLAVAAGAGITSAFTAFPWRMFVKGPLYPNFAGFAVLMLFVAVIVTCFERKLVRKHPGSFAAFVIASSCALALLHPNTLFAAYLYLAAYASHAVHSHVRMSSCIDGRKRSVAAACAGVAILAIAGLFLVACSRAPFLQIVVQYDINPYLSESEVLSAIVLLNLGRKVLELSAPEYLLALIAACGVVYCIAKRRLWLLLPCVYMALALALSCTMDSPMTRLFAGFWYNDSARLAACYELFLAPVAAYGMAGILRIPGWVKGKMISGQARQLHQRGDFPGARSLQSGEPAQREEANHSGRASFGKAIAVGILTAALFVPALPLPQGSELEFGIGTQRKLIHSDYAADGDVVYSAQEREFVKAVRDIVPEGALVLNQPHDGSMFSYALDGLNTYYRRLTGRNETDASKLIRTKLANIATESAVRDAVKSTGAEYLVMLDQGVGEEGEGWMPQYKQKKWSGINAVRDDTPGFVLVLAQDDMRLYRIDVS